MHASMGLLALLACGTQPVAVDPEASAAAAVEKVFGLHIAAAEGRVERVRALLKSRRFDPDALAPDGSTPLILACAYGYKDVVSALLSYGASPDVVDHAGVSALMWVVIARGREWDVARMLPIGAMTMAGERLKESTQRDHEKVLTMLLEHRASIDHVDSHGFSVLMLACFHGHADLASQLVDAGARTDLTLSTGLTALDLAKNHWDTQAARGLRKLMGRLEPSAARSYGWSGGGGRSGGWTLGAFAVTLSAALATLFYLSHQMDQQAHATMGMMTVGSMRQRKLPPRVAKRLAHDRSGNGARDMARATAAASRQRAAGQAVKAAVGPGAAVKSSGGRGTQRDSTCFSPRHSPRHSPPTTTACGPTAKPSSANASSLCSNASGNGSKPSKKARAKSKPLAEGCCVPIDVSACPTAGNSGTDGGDGGVTCGSNGRSSGGDGAGSGGGVDVSSRDSVYGSGSGSRDGSGAGGFVVRDSGEGDEGGGGVGGEGARSAGVSDGSGGGGGHGGGSSGASGGHGDYGGRRSGGGGDSGGPILSLTVNLPPSWLPHVAPHLGVTPTTAPHSAPVCLPGPGPAPAPPGLKVGALHSLPDKHSASPVLLPSAPSSSNSSVGEHWCCVRPWSASSSLMRPSSPLPAFALPKGTTTPLASPASSADGSGTLILLGPMPELGTAQTPLPIEQTRLRDGSNRKMKRLPIFQSLGVSEAFSNHGMLV